MSTSEIARLRQELEASAHAAWQGLYGLAEVGKPITITRRMENMTASIRALADVVGDEQAVQVWIEIENQLEGGLIANPPQKGEQPDTSSSQLTVLEKGKPIEEREQSLWQSISLSGNCGSSDPCRSTGTCATYHASTRRNRPMCRDSHHLYFIVYSYPDIPETISQYCGL